MSAAHDSVIDRITVDSGVRFGKPCIRGHRITVQEIFKWLSCGASQLQILSDYPQLEPDDFLAVYAYGAELAGDSPCSDSLKQKSTAVMPKHRTGEAKKVNQVPLDGRLSDSGENRWKRSDIGQSPVAPDLAERTRYAPDAQFKEAHRKTTKLHAGLFRRLAE